MFFKSNFLRFSSTNLSYFLTEAWAIYCYINALGILVCESYFCDQEKWSQVFHPLVLRSCKRCGLGKLVCLRVLFLREKMRDLRVQEFLRELIVDVATPSDLVGSFLVKILHSVEGGDVEHVYSNLKIILLCLWLLISLSLSCVYILHAYIVHIFICLIYLCSIEYMIWIICSH